MNSKVSVIVPVYNAEKTLDRCLTSLCAQTYKNFEILLINDGSKDSSPEICQKYVEQDSRIVLRTQENAGPSAARNAGIDLASGAYLAFVDSDDYVEPNMIESMVNKADEYDADMVICGYYEELENETRVRKYAYSDGFYDEAACGAIARDVIDNNTKSAIPPYSTIRLVRKSVMENPALRFDPTVKRSEDYFLWVQVHNRIKSLYIMGEERLYHYMYNTSSITKKYLPGYWPMCRTIFTELSMRLPQTADVKKRLEAMLIQRSLIALHNAAYADRSQFMSDFKEIVNDKMLLRAARSVGLVKNSRRAKIYALMLILRLKPLIKRSFQPKH